MLRVMFQKTPFGALSCLRRPSSCLLLDEPFVEDKLKIFVLQSEVITISANNNRLFGGKKIQGARTSLFSLLENNKRLYFVHHLMLVGGLINRFIVCIFIQNLEAVELRLVSHTSRNSLVDL